MTRRFWWLALVALLLAATPPARAGDAPAFAPATVADMLAEGSDIERLWGAYVLARALPETKRQILWQMGARIEDAREEALAAASDPETHRVHLRLRHLRMSTERLRSLGVNLNPLSFDSPPYPTRAERKAGPPYLYARLERSEAQHLEEAVEAGEIQVRGENACRCRNGELCTLRVLQKQHGQPMGVWPGRPETGVVATVRPAFPDSRAGWLQLRRVVAARTPDFPESDEDEVEGTSPCRPRVLLRGAAHPDRVHRSLRVRVRPVETVLLVPQWTVEGAWPAGEEDVLEITVEVRTAEEGASPGTVPSSTVAVETVSEDGKALTFRAPSGRQPTVGARLVVARGDRYVGVVEVVAVHGERCEARALPQFQKQAIEAGDVVVLDADTR